MHRQWIAIAFGALAATNLFAASVVVPSPDGQVVVSFDVEDGALFFSVSMGGKPVVAPSNVEIYAGAEMVVIEDSIRDNDSSWKPVYGQFSTIRDYHRELTLSLTAGYAGETGLPRVQRGNGIPLCAA